WLAVSGFCAILCVGMVYVQGRSSLWSPYYKIEVRPARPAGSGSFGLMVNNDYHQFALNLSEDWAARDSFLRDWKAIYDFPYQVFDKPAGRVLVLGAGTGNDVAAALR